MAHIPRKMRENGHRRWFGGTERRNNVEKSGEIRVEKLGRGG